MQSFGQPCASVILRFRPNINDQFTLAAEALHSNIRFTSKQKQWHIILRLKLHWFIRFVIHRGSASTIEDKDRELRELE